MLQCPGSRKEESQDDLREGSLLRQELQSQIQNLGGNCLGQTPLCEWENGNIPLCAELGAYSLSGPQTLKVVLRRPPSSILHLLLPPSPCKLLKTEMLYTRVTKVLRVLEFMLVLVTT